jgi:4-alpha-glucanotransferase
VSVVEELCASYGVAVRYTDGFRRRRRAPRETLVAVLRAIGAPLDDEGGAQDALRARRAELASASVDRATVTWDGEGSIVARSTDEASCVVELEDGGTVHAGSVSDPAGARIALSGLPFGVHRATVTAGRATSVTTIIAAPVGAARAPRSWGTFAPAYAFVSSRSWSAGDFADLSRLAAWSASLGASYVGTLPLFACYDQGPFVAGPYSPVSRLFWNEVFLDVERAPGFDRTPAARAAADAAQPWLDRARADRYVDYAGVSRAKRPVIDALAEAAFGGDSESIDRFVRDRAEVASYAAFRAEVERRGMDWTTWPAGVAPQPDTADPRWRAHVYAQWLADEQLASIRRSAGLYLDLPLGVHPGGYDTWRFRDQFARSVSAGAPPDAFFTRGQDWGAPPLQPERLRDDAYAYLRACLRTLMRHAAAIRIDHMMGFHRVFWVPHGAHATEGTYVRYPSEELYAILTLESHRAGVPVVGEDLGTVPPSVRPAMARHGIHRSYVLQEELRDDLERPLRPAPGTAMATVNTHDMPTFATFWAGEDVDQRVRDGLLDAAQAERETKRRAALRDALVDLLRRRHLIGDDVHPDAATVLDGALRLLAAMPPAIMLVPLEELWLEPEPQNTPGTGPERPNWRRKARYTIEELTALPYLRRLLRDIDTIRRMRGRRTP